MNTFIVLETNTFGVGTNAFSTSNEHVDNAHLNYDSCTSDFQLTEMIATHRCSHMKTGSSYHALVLTSEYATPT